jgi:predicted TIM-barrel fold metal-dependent hydrolase
VARTSFAIDVDQIPVVDQHCHNLMRPELMTPEAFAGALTEAYDPEIVSGHAPTSLAFMRSLRDIGELLGCEPTLEAIMDKRATWSLEELGRRCFDAARVETLLLDDGFLPDHILPIEWHARLAPYRRIWRVEYLAERLLRDATSWVDFRERFVHAVENPPPEVVSYKSIAAYRTGLAVDPPDEPAAAERFDDVRGKRLACKPINDWVVHATLRAAAARNMPIQFHTGIGDPDLDMRLANPLHLRPFFENPDLRGVKFVLLHASYPFTRELGYLVGMYPNVYADFGLAIPTLSVAGMRGVVRQLLELAPTTKVAYSSDAHVIPELYFLGARWGRRALAAELELATAQGDLTHAEAERTADRILRRNAIEVYGLGR